MRSEKERIWLFFCDGAARGNPGPGAVAFIGFDETGRLIGNRSEVLGRSTNNEAEYKAVIMCLEFVRDKYKALGFQGKVKIFSDSQLIVSQIKGLFRVKEKRLFDLVMAVKERERGLPFQVEYILVPREVNYWPDRLVNAALDGEV